MIRINLLPYQAERVKATVRNQVIIFLAFTALLIAGLWWGNSYLDGIIKDYQDKIAYTEKEIIKYNKIVAQVKEYREKLRILREKLAIIETLNKERTSAFDLLDIMTRIVVEKRMWFAGFEAMEKVKTTSKRSGKVTTKKTEVSVNIKIDGIALDEKTIADFISRLQESKNSQDELMFKDVGLVQIKMIEFKSNKDAPPIFLKDFQITGKRILPEPKKPEDGKGAKKGKK